MRRRSAVAGLVVAAGLLVLGNPALASPQRAPAPAPDHGRLDVLFIGAHPDDEAGSLSTFGQWGEDHHVRTGVLTITRGEGGGNAVGPEEGPPLGLLREGEERRAVGKAGVHDIHYLDKVDFYYTVSAPLTEDVWDAAATQEKVVRLIRETRPKVIVTMAPDPLPGQHGNHQEAGRQAVQGYYQAADPKAYPGQHLKPWRAARLFVQGGNAASPTGPGCVKAAGSDPATDTYGIWAGRKSAAQGKTWAQIEAEAQREYASQGWAGTADAPTDPAKIGCDYFTQVDSRVPFTAGNTAANAMLEGATTPAKGGLPLGTEFSLTTDSFGTAPGEPITVTAHTRGVARGSVRLAVPDGWTVTGGGRLGAPRASERTTAFTVTPPASADPGRTRIAATLTSGRATGTTDREVEVTPDVTAAQQPLPGVADFDSWAAKQGVPQLVGRVKHVLTLGSGESRTVAVPLRNTSAAARSGKVALNLPKGFTADAASKPYGPLAPGASGSVSFTVRNSDTSLPTANQGGTGGDYDYTITTTSDGGTTATAKAALELVPVTTIPEAATAPKVDGTASADEYPGAALDLSRKWEGDDCASAADCSATAKVARNGDDLYFYVKVTDDKLGSVLDPADCKRHWRTDSVELAIDPRGDAENTASTFKAGIFPTDTDGKPCFARDADNHQGPGAETAPGMTVASTIDKADYKGYTIETKIPMADLPAAVDPRKMAMNLFVYDSDTTDKTGQTRIGWSTWGGVQGDPYRWGHATLPGYTPPSGRPTQAPPPVMPKTAAMSVESPQSIAQAAATGIPLAGGPQAPPLDTARMTGHPFLGNGKVTFEFAATGPGTAHVYVWNNGTLGSKTITVDRQGMTHTTVAAPKAGKGSTLLFAFEAKKGGTYSQAAPLG
ncbi:MAG TPA: sugar-binding protein [Streptosporangiaceae bacterium]|jgi:LmbE family N-acetylglucosaminyl deacetylase